MTKSLTIKARLGITMAFLGALLIAIGGLGLAGMSRSNDAFLETFSDQMPSAIAVGNTELYAARERLVFDRAALLVGTDEVTATVARARMMRERADAYWKEYSALPQGPAEKQLADAAQAKRLALQKRVDAGLEAIAAADHDRIIAEAKAMQATYNDLSTANDALRRALTESARDGYESAQHTFSLFRTLSLLAIAAGLVAAAFAWFSLRRAIARPLDEALGHFEAIASGDLRRTVHVRSRDEMGQLLDGLSKMQTSLVTTVETMRSGSESIAAATKEIAAGNIDLSSRTEEQASALQETASSMEQLTGTVKQNADNARQASALAANASEIANKGSAVVEPGGRHDGRHQPELGEDRGHHHDHRGHRVPDQHPRAQRGRRSGARGRGRARLRGRGGRSAQLAQRSSAAAKEIKELIDTSVARVQLGHDARRRSRSHDERDHRRGAARDRHHGRDRGGIRGAEQRHRAGGARRHADGRSHAAERGARRGSGGGGPIAGGSGGTAAAGGFGVPVERQRGFVERQDGAGAHGDGTASCRRASPLRRQRRLRLRPGVFRP